MSNKTKLIAITGGIGAGKSVVSQILRKLGYSVYDSDSEARRLMDNSTSIKKDIALKIDTTVINQDGSINRKILSDIVFNDPEKLKVLNSIVHSAVREDIKQYANTQSKFPVFVETAILYQSEIDRMVDAVWDVTAPEDVRITRVMKRNSISADEVKARIKSQIFIPLKPHQNISVILNDDKTAVLPQIEQLLAEI